MMRSTTGRSFIPIFITLLVFSGTGFTEVGGILVEHSGKAVVVREGQRLPAETDMQVFEGDLLRTGEGGTLGINLSDGTTFSLGPESEQSMREIFSLPPGADSEYASGDIVGSVKSLNGLATLGRAGQQYRIIPGMRVEGHDTVYTRENGALGIVLRDDTLLSLGPSSELEMKEIVFEPSENAFGLVVALAKGTFSYVSGMIGKLAPESVRVETPVGNVTVRGTKFMARIEE